MKEEKRNRKEERREKEEKKREREREKMRKRKRKRCYNHIFEAVRFFTISIILKVLNCQELKSYWGLHLDNLVHVFIIMYL